MRRILDIIIVTLESRAHLFQKTLAALEKQIADGGYAGSVTVVVETDRGELSIGEKRNRATARCEAEYVMHLDDDDTFSETMVKDIVDAIGPGDIDCVGVRHRILMVNGQWLLAELSSKYKAKHDEKLGSERLYCVPATHMNPIRRSIMSEFPFPHINKGEDVRQALAMAEANVLKTERLVEEPIYFYVPSWLQKRKQGVRGGVRPHR